MNQKIITELSLFFNFDQNESTKFLNLIHDHKILIAGGFITKCYVNHDLLETDLDVYIHFEKFPILFDFLNQKKNCKIFKFFDISSKKTEYSFFMKKNEIKLIIRLKYFNGKINKEIDCVIPNENVNPIKLIKNFDLTCCQMYFDGHEFTELFPELNQKKEMKIQSSYLQIPLNSNPRYVFEKRLEKYKKRGFKVAGEINDDSCNDLKKFKHIATVCENIFKKIFLFIKNNNLFVHNHSPDYQLALNYMFNVWSSSYAGFHGHVKKYYHINVNDDFYFYTLEIFKNIKKQKIYEFQILLKNILIKKMSLYFDYLKESFEKLSLKEIIVLFNGNFSVNNSEDKEKKWLHEIARLQNI